MHTDIQKKYIDGNVRMEKTSEEIGWEKKLLINVKKDGKECVNGREWKTFVGNFFFKLLTLKFKLSLCSKNQNKKLFNHFC